MLRVVKYLNIDLATHLLRWSNSPFAGVKQHRVEQRLGQTERRLELDLREYPLPGRDGRKPVKGISETFSHNTRK